MFAMIINITVALLYTPVYWSILLLDKLRVEKALSGANEGRDL